MTFYHFTPSSRWRLGWKEVKGQRAQLDGDPQGPGEGYKLGGEHWQEERDGASQERFFLAERLEARK